MVIVDPARKLSCLHGSRRSSSSICLHPPLIFWFLSHRRFSTHFSRNAVSQNFGNFRFVPERIAQKSELSLHQMAVRAFFGQKIRAVRPSNGCADDFRTKIRAERLSNGYPSQGPTEPPLHRNSALLVEAHWSAASSGRGITPYFGPRLLCVLESCLLLSRTATHGQSPGAGVDVPSLTYSPCWRSHLRREALAPEAASCQLSFSTCSLKLAQSIASRGPAPEAWSAQLAALTNSLTHGRHSCHVALRQTLCLSRTVASVLQLYTGGGGFFQC